MSKNEKKNRVKDLLTNKTYEIYELPDEVYETMITDLMDNYSKDRESLREEVEYSEPFESISEGLDDDEAYDAALTKMVEEKSKDREWLRELAQKDYDDWHNCDYARYRIWQENGKWIYEQAFPDEDGNYIFD